MGASVGYLEAWGLWWQGVDLRPMSLYGFPMIWVGRIAKIVTFVAGLTVLLDLVGPARVTTMAVNARGALSNRTDLLGALLITSFIALFLLSAFLPQDTTWASIALGLVTLAIAVTSIVAAPILFIIGLAALLRSHTRQIVLRWASVALLVLGFSFDLLTS